MALGIAKSKERFGMQACHDNITVVVAYVKMPEPVVIPESILETVTEVIEPVAAPDAPELFLIPELPYQYPQCPMNYSSILMGNNNYRGCHFRHGWNNNFGRNRGRYPGSGKGRGNF